MLPGPTNVPDRVTRAMTRPLINHRSPEFSALYESIEQGLKYVFQTRNPVYTLTASGTGGVDCAINNIVNPDDKIIVPVYGVFSQRIKEKIERYGGKPITLNVEWGQAPTAQQIADAAEKNKDAKAIAVVYNETSTGATVRDLPEIGKIAKQNNMLFIVDAISIMGGDRTPVDKWNIDVCVAGSQKCIACPPGLVMVSVNERAFEAIEKTKARSYYFDLISLRESGLKKETPYTPAIPLFYALDEALKIAKEEGLEKRIQRHATCAKAFYRAFEAMNIAAFAEKSVRSNTVIAIKVPNGLDGDKIRKILKEKHNVVIAGGAGKIKQLIFRIGCMGIVSETEVLATIDAFEKTLTEVGYPLKIDAGVEAAKRVFRQ